jgi:hypothetical protein
MLLLFKPKYKCLQNTATVIKTMSFLGKHSPWYNPDYYLYCSKHERLKLYTNICKNSPHCYGSGFSISFHFSCKHLSYSEHRISFVIPVKDPVDYAAQVIPSSPCGSSQGTHVTGINRKCQQQIIIKYVEINLSRSKVQQWKEK